ncbi:Uma2 family endonuclease [bacterium]|nr:MAG: Uma2 family endonuclease [bacterium]
MAVAAALVSPEEYLRREEKASEKSEYRKGMILAMAGASTNHVVISSNLHTVLGPLARTKGCFFLNSDAKVWVEAAGAFYYPDGSIACPPHFVNDPAGAFDNPKVIFEIISPSSESADRGTKFKDYATLLSLEEYVLIESGTPDVQIFRREAPDQWSLTFYSGLEKTARLATLDIEISLRELFALTTFGSHRES